MKHKNEELLKINKVENESEKNVTYEVSKIIEARIKTGLPAFLVSWVGYRSKKDRTVELESQLMEDVPKMVSLFKKRNGVSFVQIKTGKQKGRYRVKKSSDRK